MLIKIKYHDIYQALESSGQQILNADLSLTTIKNSFNGNLAQALDNISQKLKLQDFKILDETPQIVQLLALAYLQEHGCVYLSENVLNQLLYYASTQGNDPSVSDLIYQCDEILAIKKENERK